MVLQLNVLSLIVSLFNHVLSVFNHVLHFFVWLYYTTVLWYGTQPAHELQRILYISVFHGLAGNHYSINRYQMCSCAEFMLQ